MIILALILLFIVGSRYKYSSVEFISLFIFFLYGYSLELDYYIFGVEMLQIPGLQRLYVGSDTYLLIRGLYLSFMIGYFAVVMSGRGQRIVEIESSNKLIHKILLILWSFLLLYLSMKLYGLHRLEKMRFISNIKYLHYFSSIGMIYSIGVLWTYSKYGRISMLERLLLLSVFVYGIMDGGRELFVYVLLGIIPFIQTNKRMIPVLIITSSMIFALALWKPVTAALAAGLTLDQMFEAITTSGYFSISGLDPKPSLLLISNYLEGNNMFEDMAGSYVINMFGQIGSAVGLVDYTSLARTIMLRVNESAAVEGVGLAFSGILESLLNFWIFGPFILGMILALLIRLSRSYMNLNMIYVFLGLIALKLVRTELMVVFKLYGLPMLICAALFMMKKRKNNEIF